MILAPVAGEIDDRVHYLFQALGYYLFPFHGFDTGGGVVTGSIDIPAELTRELKDVTQKPDWNLIYSRLAALGMPGSGQGIYSLGTGFDERGVALMFFKSLGTIPADGDIHRYGPGHAKNWVQNMGVGSMHEVQRLAGRGYVFDQNMLANIQKVLDFLKEAVDPGSGGGGAPNVPQEPPAEHPGEQPAPDKPHPPGGGGRAEAADDPRTVPLIDKLTPVLAVKLLSKLVETAGKLEHAQSVTAIHMWFVPEEWGDSFKDHADSWNDLLRFKPYWDNDHSRAVSVIWDPANAALWNEGNPADWADRPEIPHRLAEIYGFLFPYGGEAELREGRGGTSYYAAEPL